MSTATEIALFKGLTVGCFMLVCLFVQPNAENGLLLPCFVFFFFFECGLMCTHLLNTFDDLSVILHYANHNCHRGRYKEKTFALQVHSVLKSFTSLAC